MTARLPNTARLFRLLLWVQWRSMVARGREAGRKSRLLVSVLVAFVIGYLCVGYFLFEAGLGFLHRFPLVGGVLSERLLYLIFGFFLVMLAFSNLIIGYSTLFKNRETEWFLTLPVGHRDVYRWKFCESLVVSSWALVFLSAPLMAAYGNVHGVDGWFYVKVGCAYVPFVVVPAVVGSWGIVALVRVLAGRYVKAICAVLGVAVLVWLVVGVKPFDEGEARASDAVSIDQIMRHTRMSLNPFLPSAWLAQAVTSWRDGMGPQGGFFFLLLASNALFGLLVGSEVVSRWFFPSWSEALGSRAERFQRAAEAKRVLAVGPTVLERAAGVVSWMSRPAAALLVKDVRLFWRDPAQWIQFMIFFGLLCIYVLNLRNVAFSFRNDFWETLISYLNLTASALTLSTLTTRFVFPQFSLEGRRIWILGLAPIGLGRVLVQKFWLSCIGAMGVTMGLMVTSSLMLNLAWDRVAFFAVAIGLMSASLSSLAVSLGALFPNLREDNPSKIVSGFGGTLCLVVSFVYIAVFVSLIALPDLRRVARINLPVPDVVLLSLALGMSAAVIVLPLLAAVRRVRNLEI